MNPRRKRSAFDLYKNTRTRAPSGATKDSWVKQDVQVIASLYDQSAQNQLTLSSTGARVKQYDYLALTSAKWLETSKYRLERNGIKYAIKGVNNEGRLSQLFLEVLKNE